MTDDLTPTQRLPLPAPGNLLSEDVLRLRAALQSVDGALDALQQAVSTKAEGAALAGAVESLNSDLARIAEDLSGQVNAARTEAEVKFGNFKTGQQITGDTQLTAEQAGTAFQVCGAFTITLPKYSSVPPGGVFAFFNNTAGTAIIQRFNADDQIGIVTGNKYGAAIAVGPSDSLTLFATGGCWHGVSGSVAVASSTAMIQGYAPVKQDGIYVNAQTISDKFKSYNADTRGGSFTIYLPGNPQPGDWVAINDEFLSFRKSPLVLKPGWNDTLEEQTNLEYQGQPYEGVIMDVPYRGYVVYRFSNRGWTIT
jgi:hypothetical protein